MPRAIYFARKPILRPTTDTSIDGTRPPDGGPGRGTDSDDRDGFVYLAGHLSGGFLLVGGAVALAVVGPGYSTLYPGIAPALAITLAGLAGIALLARSAREYRRRRPRLFTRRESRGAAIVGGSGASVFVAMILLSSGLVPGFYLPSQGHASEPILGCLLRPGHIDPPFPPPVVYVTQGFPPGSRVDLSWSTGSSVLVSVAMYQTAPTGNVPTWSYVGNGTGGNLSFSGTGGVFAWIAENLTSCIYPASVGLSWTYTPLA